jgi:hypothetical protein
MTDKGYILIDLLVTQQTQVVVTADDTALLKTMQDAASAWRRCHCCRSHATPYSLYEANTNLHTSPAVAYCCCAEDVKQCCTHSL